MGEVTQASAAAAVAIQESNANAGTGPTRPIPQVVFILGPDGTVRFARSSADGETDEEPSGMGIDAYVAPDQREFVRQTLGWVFRRGQPSGFELRGLLPRYPNSWFQCRLVPNPSNGRIVSATLVATDISTYKQRELDLEQEREELRAQVVSLTSALNRATAAAPAQASRPEASNGTGPLLPAILDGLADAIFLIDSATQRIVDVNQTACRWLRRSRTEVVNRPAAEVSNGIPLVPSNDSTDPPFTQTRTASRSSVLQGACRRADGSAFAVQSTLTRVELDGKYHVVAVVRDAKHSALDTQQGREVEQRYRDLFESTRDAVLLVNRAGVVSEANPAAATLFGYSIEDLTGLDLQRLLLFRPEARALLQERSARQEAVRDLPVQIRRRDEWRLSAALSTMPLRTADGSIRGYQCVVRPTGRPSAEHQQAGEPPRPA